MASIDIIDLTGIGPVVTRVMNELGVFTTADLLRAQRRRLAEKVSGVSLAQVRRWQAIAELLEVKGVTLLIAEGLYAGGVETLDELGARSLNKLRPVLETMHTQGVVPTLPSDDDLVAWMKDALLLRHTGTLNGTVIGADRSPAVGVAVSCMGQRVESDARGRFRLRRLPLGRRLLVYFEHPAYAAKTVKTGPVAPAGVLVGKRFRLARKRAGAPPPRVLSELEGDKLPALSGAPVRERAQDGAPSPLDILRVVELLASGNVRVISHLFDHDGADFLVRSYRFKRRDLPAQFEVGDHLRYKAQRWQVVKMTPATIDRYRRWLRERRQLPELSADSSAADVQRFVEDWLLLHARS
ncbi:MAG: DUF4332 domain-containing protein [Acidobacteriota bacterium]|nr:DUF4332 domain-containing protein [Acidobacteriota bacterium]